MAVITMLQPWSEIILNHSSNITVYALSTELVICDIAQLMYYNL